MKLVRTTPCVWGATAQVAKLVNARLNHIAAVRGESSSTGGGKVSAEKDDDSWGCVTRPERSTINLRTRDMLGNDIFFKCKPTTQLSKLFTAYCYRTNNEMAEVQFHSRGHLINGDSTPSDLGLEDGDTIEVTYIQ